MSPHIRSINFPCPACGGAMQVKDSRPTHFHGENAIRRRRACRAAICGHRITTMEIVDDGRTDIGELVAAAAAIQSACGDFVAKVRNGKS